MLSPAPLYGMLALSRQQTGRITDREDDMTASRALRTIAIVLAAIALAPHNPAKAYPDKPVRIIVPYAAGGNTDAIARLIGGFLSEKLGQTFVVDNRGGASGTIAAEAVARATPDGYTLFLSSLPQMAIVPNMMQTKYDPLKDFAPISNIGFNNFILTVNPKLPVKSAAELVDYVKKSAAPLNYASGGPGSHMNLTMQLFLKTAGIKVTPVHLRGGAEPMNNIVAGHIPMAFLNASDVAQQASAGTVRALAITAEKRNPQLPGIPTMIEAGFKDFVVTSWNGLSAPAGTPAAVIEKLAGEVANAMRDQKVSSRFASLGVTPNAHGSARYATEIKEAYTLWGDVVRSAGLQEKR
jgi:tripartite-type tricarboxylate transporter receptor subunit TctC